MHYLKRIARKNGEDAVSPVIGVMLMLVVTIILAAVVSAFAGGMVGGSNQKAPTLAMDVRVTHSGNMANAAFYATVLSISEPTSTSNLKIVTSWRSKNATSGAYTIGTGTSQAGTNVPYGFGPGVSGTVDLSSPTIQQYFGNYTLTQGTGLIAQGSSAATVLGSNCNLLNPGDIVNVRVIHIPTGRAIFQKDIAVTEG